jgi:hypothetical protein
MKHFILIFTLFLSAWAYTQPNRDELALKDETTFDLSFMFQYEKETGVGITLSRKNSIDYLAISGNNTCRRNNVAYQTPIADLYVYEQFLDYLQNINIANYQPSQSNINTNAKLKVQASISIPNTWTMNAFVFQYHPDNVGDEKQMLAFIVNILKDNATDDCSRDLAETLSVYVNGE